MPELLTVGQIAEEVGEPLHRVTYAIRRHRVPVAARAGVLRFFRRNAIPLVRAALAKTAAASHREAVEA